MKRVLIVLALFLATVFATGCNCTMINRDELQEFRILYIYLIRRVQFDSRDLEDGAWSLKKTLDKWCGYIGEQK